MPKIATNEVVPGMITNIDIEDKNGRTLLPENTVIEKNHLRILKMWGIYEIDINNENNSFYNQNINNSSDHSNEIVSSRFLKANITNPCIKELFKRNIAMYNEYGDIDNKPFYNEISLSQVEDPDFQRSKYITENQILKNHLELLTLPDIFQKLMDVISRPNSSASDVAEIIKKDSALSAATLRLVNSPFYGFANQIDSIYNAVVILGTQQISVMSMGLSVVNIFNEIPSDFIDMKKLWLHSLGVGICSRIIAGHLGIKELNLFFLAGILHDIGRLVLIKEIPGEINSVIKYAWKNNLLITEAEQSVLGFTHSDIGEKICIKWNLPLIVSDIAGNHHNPEKSQMPYQCSIVHLAEIIVNGLKAGSSGEKLVLPVNEYAWNILDISENAIPVIIEEFNTEINTTLELIG
jgi:HD-like signal output (HDOD) protein